MIKLQMYICIYRLHLNEYWKNSANLIFKLKVFVQILSALLHSIYTCTVCLFFNFNLDDSEILSLALQL